MEVTHFTFESAQGHSVSLAVRQRWHGSYEYYVWPSSVALAHYLATHPPVGLSALEVF